MKRTMPNMMLISLLVGMLVLACAIQQVESSEPPETEWSRTYGGTGEDIAGRTGAGDVVKTSDEGYAIAGYTNSFGAGDYDFWLVKVDCDGDMEWNKTYGETDNDVAECVVQTNDEGYAIVGWTGPFGVLSDQRALLVKTDSFGNMEWTKTYGGPVYDWANYVIQTSDGGFAIAGETFSLGAGGADFWLIKTDSFGNVEWMEAYGGTGDDVAYCVIQVSDGGYALVGRTRSFGAGRDDFWLVKTDSYGNISWTKTYGGSNWEMAESIVQTNDGGYAIVGYTESFGAGDEDFWLVKTDSYGNMEWDKTYGGLYIDAARSVVQTTDQGYAITGHTQSFGVGSDDFWLVKTDLSGNMEWNQTYGGSDSDDAYSVVQTNDGGYAIAGTTLSFGAGSFDFWVIKLEGVDSLPVVPPPEPVWMQWWFWAIVGLGGTNVIFAYFAFRYRRLIKSKTKTITPKEMKLTKGTVKTCPNCGVRLPVDAEFCGKCGKRLKQSP